jgi:hypothetical protein
MDPIRQFKNSTVHGMILYSIKASSQTESGNAGTLRPIGCEALCSRCFGITFSYLAVKEKHGTVGYQGGD